MRFLSYASIFFCTLYSTSSCAEYHYIGPTISWRNQGNNRNSKEPKYSHDYSFHNDRNIYQIDSSHSHQPNFNQYNSQDFRDYFTTHEYTESQILDQRCLYMFDEFVKFAQTYPSYSKPY